MNAALYLVAITALLHFVVTIGIDKFRRWQQLRQFARQYSCKPTLRENPWDLLGLYKVGTAARHVINGDSLVDAIRLFKTYGETYSSRLLAQMVFFTCHPRNIRQVLVTRFVDYDSSKGIRDHLFRPITAHGIFALDGAEWKKARGLYRDQFSNTRAIFDLDLQERCFQNLLRRIPAGEAVDFQPLFLQMTLDLTTAFAMGESTDALLSPDQSAAKREFVDSLIFVKKIMARDGFLGPVHIFLSKKNFHIACGKVHQFVEDVIRKKLEAIKNPQTGPILAAATSSPSSQTTDGDGLPLERRPNCLLDGLIEASTDLAGLRDGVVTILIAGIDSVASLLSTTFFLLAQHERVFDKLRNSVLETLGYQRPTYEQLRSLTYLRHVFNETMRVYPPVPFNARTANKDTYLPVGGGPDGQSSVLVKKGQRVVFSSWGSHRSFDYFGDDAYDFRPERWESVSAQTLAGYIPFNLGPRACPGQHYALAEASYATVRLLQSFSRIESRDDRAWKENLGLNLSNKNGTVVELTRDRLAQNV